MDVFCGLVVGGGEKVAGDSVLISDVNSDA